jgi:GH25 family lysozyme M1 (1,4-beta-N-acetylmuramidase)
MRRALLAACLCAAGCAGAPAGDEQVEGLSQTCPSTYVEGIDLNDRPSPVDWPQMKQAGVQWMIAKATQGTYNTQSSFAYNWSQAKAAGVIRGAYHFFDPTEDGVAQAQHFLAVMGPLEPGDLPPMLDAECPSIYNPNDCLGWAGGGGQTPGNLIRQRILDFMNTVENATGRAPILYTLSMSWFTDEGVDTSGFGRYALDLPQIGSNCISYGAPWDHLTIWQYDWYGTFPGVPGQWLRDRFLGTLDDLKRFAAGPTQKRLSAVANADGRLQVFYAAPGNSWLYDDAQLQPGQAWAGVTPFGGAASQLSTVRNADGRLEVLYVGTDQALYHNWQSAPGGAWQGQAALGGAAKQVSAVANADGRLEIFYVGTNDHLFHNWQSTPGGAWHGEAELGGAARQIEVAVNQNGATEIFYIGTNDRLYHRWLSAAGWSGETALGGAGKQIAITRNADGRLELFYIGTDDGLYHNWQNAPGAAWHGEASLGGRARQLAVGQNADGRLELFYTGTNDALYHRWFSATGWSGEAALGGAARQLAVSANADGRLELFYLGTNDVLYHNWQSAPGQSWHGQATL